LIRPLSVQVLSEGPPSAGLRQIQLFTRVMNRIKNAYQKEKAKKESASIATSVKTVLRNRKSNAQEDVENDSTEDEEATHSLENVSFRLVHDRLDVH
jgi:capsid protein